jgi:NADPH:quinone reductase-like Zn-dependent oxidoreductase
MRAVALHRFGGPEVLGVITLPVPTPDSGEVVVRVVAATVNPTDVLLRAGLQAAGMTSLAPPYIPGMEFAGHVHQVGDDVTRLHAGQPVMGIVDARRPKGGGAQAEYVVVPAASVVPVPADADLVEAATVPMNGVTALVAVEQLDASPDDVILVTGGPGALGGYVIQLAKAAGLTVVADSNEADVPLLRALGADEIVPRGAAMPAAVRELYPEGVHGLVDAARIGPPAHSVVRDGGTSVSVRRSDEVADERLRHHYVAVPEYTTDTASLERLADLVAAGRLTPRVAVRLPMDQAAEGHRLVERGGLRGRVVLTIG